MLIPTMSNKEINQEIDRDYQLIINSSTLPRLTEEYHKERKRRKIGREEDYILFREFKTKSKNRWITRLMKNPDEKSYRGPQDTVTTIYCYYYTDKGLRLFFSTESGVKSVFNGHMFTRYRERMALPIMDTMDLVKHFLSNNLQMNFQVMPRVDNEQKFVGISREGFIPGSVDIENDEFVWFVHKTFINKETANLRMTNTAEELIGIMRNNLVKAEHRSEEKLYDDLLRLYNDFGLMTDADYPDDIHSRLKQIVEEVRNSNMRETEFWKIV